MGTIPYEPRTDGMVQVSDRPMVVSEPAARPLRSQRELLSDAKSIRMHLQEIVRILEGGDSIAQAHDPAKELWVVVGYFTTDISNQAVAERLADNQHLCEGPGVCEHGKTRAHKLEGVDQ